MKINLAKSAGFCFGVKRAIEIAHKTASSGKKVYMLGDIVHNEEVAEQIRRLGIKKVKRLSSGKGRVFLIRAHGSEKKIVRKVAALGYQVIDATCPMVKEIHRIVRRSECRGRKIIVIGDKNHDEVRGIIGQLKTKALIIDPQEKIPRQKIKKIKKACAVVQSTQNMDEVPAIRETLRSCIPEFEFFNTICRPTRIKQQEIKSLPKENELMLIIGSRTSANTKRLYQISKALNPRTYWIGSKKEIKPSWFRGINSVGISAGASTPDAGTKEVIACLKKLAKSTPADKSGALPQ